MARNSPKQFGRTKPGPADDDAATFPQWEEKLPESARNPEEARPVDQGRVPPRRSRDEANIDTDEALPSDEEEETIAENPEREEVRFGNVKMPRKD
ncbi:hypothetical protein PZN02_005017 [Sinorhizobium garamanticum]|uniref:Uncharacterized protein n=1 Tax=Sinorhizobium garamanticum TaxID=680247 RepID=A0ABY8DFM6_9HYPH|nr:hypothetical protein [Sinorhizobium garamanticum]WEX89706.1 hypothetical protein PZN02_005017 [Sinorhizobium garamanticum]